MPSKTKENFNPVYGYRKNVFVINDVDLIVPPTNINVQTEDLTWQWKALRQKASTKIPSGSGQIACQVSIPFTASMVLDMHRLIVQFRHSPFCYIENRFLRETVVPHWPMTQSMAFTMTNLSIAPMQGTSDTWVMTLDLTWFNYFPYVHNWFYRHDWHTLPVQADGGLSFGRPVELTIGWDWQDGNKIRRQNVLPTLASSTRKSVTSWNAVQNAYDTEDIHTIDDMELAFRGEIFDSMPMPSKMIRAQYVRRPSRSKIYTRYINFLQRDALMESFNIDVEAMASDNLKAALFSAIKINEDRYTYGLHTGPNDVDSQLYNEWLRLKTEVAAEMNSYHRKMQFHFCAYQEVRLPKEYNETIARAHQTSVNNAKLSPNSGYTGDSWLIAKSKNDATDVARYRLRMGFSNPSVERTTPVGKPGSNTPMPVSDLRITSRLKWRDVATRNRLYPGRNYTQGYMHWGTDFGGAEGTPVFAVEAGTISSVKLTSSANGHYWKLYNNGKSGYITDTEDFKKSIQAFDSKIIVSGKSVSRADGNHFPVGTFVKSLNNVGGWYYVEGSATGNKVTITHGNNYSSYFHLSGVEPNIVVGARVQAGTKIGTMGNTGFLNKDYVDAQAKAAQQQLNSADSNTRRFLTRTNGNMWTDENGEESSVWGFARHLHFEYWESQDVGFSRDKSWEGNPELEERWRSKSRHIPVDPVGTFDLCDKSDYKLTIDPKLSAPTQSTVKSTLEEEAKESSEFQTSEDIAAVTQVLENLWADGWYYYDRDSSIKNVWWKHHILDIEHNEESMSEGFLDVPLAVTAAAGGLQNIVANIPILGHEFPTQQHLGSVEPFYSFEFCAKDFEGSGTQHLAGISKKAEVLLAMRSLVHANARNFRPIMDSWCVAVDSFITRLLGSYKDADHREATIEQDGEQVITDLQLKKRMLNTRSNSMTVPGSPGLTCHTLDFMETNPYVEQTVTAIATSQVDKKEAHKKILHAVYNLDFTGEFDGILDKILIAQLAGANTTLPGEEDYGQINLDYVNHPGTVTGNNVAAYRDSNDVDWLIFGDDFSAFANHPGSIGKLAGSTQDFAEAEPSFQGINAVPLSEVFGTDGAGGVDKIAKYGTEFNEQKYTIKDGVKINNYITPRQYDIKSILNESRNNQLIGEIPLEKILMYSQIVHTLVDSANQLLAETQDQLSFGSIQPGGTTIDTARTELYDLPITPGLYNHFRAYMVRAATLNPMWGPTLAGPVSVTHPSFQEVTQHISQNPNWIQFNNPIREKDIQEQFEKISGGYAIMQAAEDGVDSSGSIIRGVMDFAMGTYEKVTELTYKGTVGLNSKGVWADLYSSRQEEMLEDFALGYMRFLPMRDLLEERFKSFVSSSVLGNFLGGVTSADGQSPVFASTTEQLKETLRSCGSFQVRPMVDTISYIVEPYDAGKRAIGNRDDIVEQSLNSNPENEVISVRGSEGDELSSDEQYPLLGEDGTWKWFFLNGAKGIKKLNSPFVWHVDAGLETSKINYFKRLLSKYAEEMRNDIDILRAFGLTDYSNISVGAAITGSPALPDMDLPHHPYYGTVTACPPDFYMWNMYDDGNAHNEAVMEAIEDSMENIITNCYNSMNRIQDKNKKPYQPSSDSYVLEPEADDRISLPMHYSAEATDNSDVGATAFPFYPNPNSTEAIAKHVGDVNDATKKALEKADAARSGGTPVHRKLIISAEQAKALSGTTEFDVRVSNFEGAFGEGGGVQYPRRMTSAAYDQLFAQVKTMEQMFGSRSGYLDEQEIPGTISERLQGSVLEREKDPTHKFDKDALNKLAKESTADIFGQKRQLRRAYPTFKLFFVEEDEFEDRLLNFDDFYSYNGVTSFTIEQSRKSPADHAVITLLNVAGTLDGTKRDAVVDLDYFGEESKIKVPRSASTSAGNPVTQDTVLDQPFGALVLRPGLNVQLRVGYSNDPDLLEVMLNGRVVDVTWNSGGDRAEILVQSFGTELQQIIKGTTSQNDSRSFPTTHHLLGALMLEPELVHFGRWEFGQLYQVGEGSDARLDFYDYSSQGNFGSFRAPAAITEWFLDHPVITATVAVGGAAAITRIPGIGRFFGKFGARGANALSRSAAKTTRLKWVGRWLDNLGASGPGTAALRKAFVRRLSANTSAAVTTASKVTRADVNAVLRARASQLALRSRAVRQAGENVGAASQFAQKAASIQRKAITRAAGQTADEAAQILARADAEIGNLILKGQWGYNPLAQLAGESVGLLAQTGSIAKASIGRVFNGLLTKQPVFLAGVATAALATAPLDWGLSAIYNATLKRFQAYFRTKQVSLFLSPQDDNLFPPHPKDYMKLTDDDGFFDGLYQDFKDYVIKQGISAFTSSDQLGYQGLRWFKGEHPLDKRAAPDDYNYKLYSTTIWDVFHEMTLRHPGWIYAARPYGKQFRYTMFFGVPSQRYWSRGADNEFIKRANDLSRMLSDKIVTKEEYRRLYGEVYDDGEQSYDLEEFDKILEEQIVDAYTSGKQFESSVSTDGITFDTQVESDYDAVAIEQELDSARKIAYTSRALEEYLKALELRFKPFRRYHSITSEEDIVWNGLISSENAVYNAVDVTYFDTDADMGDSPASSALFKAHAFIPDHNLRVMPMQPSYNTRGYTLAMRYGQGALLHTMREMYRGEIIVLGNHRIRPWDVGILSDSYNDMVGPFEVEQVVHQFSHETGFITEIKPSAFVVGNETSSWPILEAMKVASLAIRDVQDQFEGMSPSDPGAKFKALEWALGFGGNIDEDEFPGAAEEYREYLAERAKELRPFDFTANPDTGESDLREIRELEDLVGKTSRRLVGTTAGVVGGVLAFAGASVALKGIAATKFGASAAGAVPQFFRSQSAWAKGAAIIGGATAANSAVFAMNKTTPSISWLLGSPILFMQCLRNDSIMLVPLMKQGKPIVSGVSLRDPGSIWNAYKGELGRWVEDHFEGTKNLTDLWRIYGMHAWRRNATLENVTSNSSSISNGKIADVNSQLWAELTGETR